MDGTGIGFGGWRARLAEAMEDRGAWPARSPWIRAAVEALPRDLFAPERLWRWDGHAYVPVDRDRDGLVWARELYSSPDEAAVTQVIGGMATSSLSCQAVVVDMLDSLLLEPGQRVLDLGTGAGWNAALAAHRAGPGRVTSVEVDPTLADTARQRLREAGLQVLVETGDGATGWPGGAPFHRVIATYAVEHIPWAWVQQCAPGGRIVTPWGRLGHVALTVADDGSSASGWMQGLAQFMPARDSAPGTGRGYRDIRGQGDPDHQRPVRRDLAPLRGDWDLLFALRVALPDVHLTTATDLDGVCAWLHDGEASWAALSTSGGRTVAHQGGPRRLADELETAWQRWEQLGRPGVYDYGMTVTPAEQFVWLHDPDVGPRWPTPPLITL